MRFLGPLGRPTVAWILARRVSFLPDTSQLKTAVQQDWISEYLYQNWALPKSGEVAFNRILTVVRAPPLRATRARTRAGG